MRSRTRILVGVVCALIAPALFAQGSEESLPTSRWPSKWTEPIEPFPVADRVYYVGTAELGAYLFVSEQGLVLLDVPMRENVERVLQSIRTLGFDPEDVGTLIATHGHFDHVGGFAELQRATGAEVVLSRHAAELIGSGGEKDFFVDYPFEAVEADRVIANGELLRVGDLELLATVTPGHTRGCTSWSATVTVEGAPRRLVVVCSLSVLPGYQLVENSTGAEVAKPASYPGIGEDYCRSLVALSDLEPEVFLANHGSFFGLAEKRTAGLSAFVDPQGLARYLERASRSVERTLAAQGVEGGCDELLGRPR